MIDLYVPSVDREPRQLVPENSVGWTFAFALAAAVLSAHGKAEWERLEKTLLLGELALDGRVRPVKGVLPGRWRSSAASSDHPRRGRPLKDALNQRPVTVPNGVGGTTSNSRAQPSWSARRCPPWPAAPTRIRGRANASSGRCLAEPWCDMLAHHLGLDEAQEAHRRGRRYSTAATLARLFTSYGESRPSMITAWAASENTDGYGSRLREDMEWQAILWRGLRAHIGEPSRAAVRPQPGQPIPRRLGRVAECRITLADTTTPLHRRHPRAAVCAGHRDAGGGRRRGGSSGAAGVGPGAQSAGGLNGFPLLDR